MIRLTGTRFARVYWSCSDSAGTARIHINDHWWDVTAPASGVGYSLIDLCEPTGTSDTGGAPQSIIGYELPDDISDTNNTGGPVRGPLSQYLWKYPAGSGVGMVTDLAIECQTPGATYTFNKIALYRKAISEGGWARLYVLPHRAGWVDSRIAGEITLPNSGQTPLGTDGGQVYFRSIQAQLIIDGALVMEIPAGDIMQQWDTQSLPTDDYPWPRYYFTANPLIPGQRPLAFPLAGNYANPNSYGTNGVVDVVVGTPASDLMTQFAAANSTMTNLEPGIYNLDSVTNIPALPLWDQQMYPSGAMHGWTQQYITTTYRGRIYGITTPNTTVRIQLPGASPGASPTDVTVTSDALGWFEIPALNTKAAANYVGTDTGSDHLEYQTAQGALSYDPVTGHLMYQPSVNTTIPVTLRNRFWTRFNVPASP
jgi:hypothetical protein